MLEDVAHSGWIGFKLVVAINEGTNRRSELSRFLSKGKEGFRVLFYLANSCYFLKKALPLDVILQKKFDGCAFFVELLELSVVPWSSRTIFDGVDVAI